MKEVQALIVILSYGLPWWIAVHIKVNHVSSKRNSNFEFAANHEEWLKKRLDQKQQLPPNVPAGNLELTRLVHYRIAKGLKAQVMGAYGMPG